MAYNKAFKEETIKLAQGISTRKAADQLRVSFYTLYEWRRSQERYVKEAYVGSGHKQPPLDPQEQRITEMKKSMS